MYLFQRLLIISIFLIFSHVNAHAAQFVSVSDKKAVDLEYIVKNIAGTDVIFVGETHDSTLHHQAQHAIVRSLQAKKSSIAIGLEIFTTADQQALDDWIGGKLSEESFIPIYSRNWSYNWSLYRDLFMFARDNHIPLIALNIPKAVMATVRAKGAAAVPGNELPPKMSWTLNEPQTRYIRAIGTQVFGEAPPEKLLARLCAAQALRNSGMAWQVAQYKSKHAAATVVVLAGMWHAVKSGVPAMLATYDKFTYQVILPELPEFNLQNATVNEADYLMMQ